MRFSIIFLLCTVFAACNENHENSGPSKTEPKTDSVKTFLLSLDSAQKNISLPGDLLPNENVLIRAKVPGYISKLNVDIGSKVNKGQVLALIEAPEIETRLQELNEKVKTAKSKYRASKDYYDRLYIASQSDGVIAPSELERTRNLMLADSSEFNASLFAASSYRQVGNYLAIVAPYSGTITKRNIEAGSFVGNAGDPALFELEDNAVLRLHVPVPDIYTNAVLKDNSGELTTRSMPDKKYKAVLVRKSGSIDNQTRSELWEFILPNADGELKAGSYSDIRLRFIRVHPSMVVPSSAVVTSLEKKYVIKISGGLTQWVDVRAGFNMGDKQEIFGDLKPGDTLVLKGSEDLKSGTKVIPK